MTTAHVELDWNITLDTIVREPGDECTDEDHAMDGSQCTAACGGQICTLGELIADKALRQATSTGGLTMRHLAERIRAITDQEIATHARKMIIRVLSADPAAFPALTVSEVTLAAMIEAQVWQQLNDPSPTTMTRGQQTPVINALVATAATEGLRGLAAAQVEQIRAAALAELGRP